MKNINIDGLKELKENGLKGLKISGLKNLILKPEDSGTECVRDAELEDLAKEREEIKRKIKKLNQEKEGIETRIHLIRKTGKEKCEEITEFPWREEIFPPLPRRKYVKIPGTFETKDGSLHAEVSGFLEVKESGMKIKVKEINEKPEENTPEEKMSKDMDPTIIQTMIVDNADSVEGACLKNDAGKKDEDKTFSEKKEKTKTVYPFSAEKLNENKILSRDSSNNSIEKKKTESKNNPVVGLLGENQIEELLSTDGLNPEGEQGFMKYLQEPEMGELIDELKDIRSLLARAKYAG